MPTGSPKKPRQPMAEIFGFPIHTTLEEATRYRQHRLCPFNNKVPNCTKDKADSPLGVCSVFTSDGKFAITCPVRFREKWLIASDAADFFFSEGVTWTSLTEVRLADAHGQSAGNIDVVLVAYDEQGRITDYGSLEVQAVYISGNVRKPFEHFTATGDKEMDWTGEKDFPRPDFLSSSRKRLAPQLLYKGGILHHWGRKMAVALDQPFFETLPQLTEVPKDQAEMVWLIYNIVPSPDNETLVLTRYKKIYTKFEAAIFTITTAVPGDEKRFIKRLQTSLDARLKGEAQTTAPDPPGTIGSPFEEDNDATDSL